MEATEIKYDVPIEVTQKQYNSIMNSCCGVVAGREADGKYYIKVWHMVYVHEVRKHLI